MEFPLNREIEQTNGLEQGQNQETRYCHGHGKLDNYHDVHMKHEHCEKPRALFQDERRHIRSSSLSI